MAPYELYNFFPVYVKNVIRMLTGVALNLYIALGSMETLTLLIPTINENGIIFLFCYCYCLITKPRPCLCNPMDCSTLGPPVFHYLPEFGASQVAQERIFLLNARDKRYRLYSWVGKIPWRRAWQFTPVFLPRESYG